MKSSRQFTIFEDSLKSQSVITNIFRITVCEIPGPSWKEPRRKKRAKKNRPWPISSPPRHKYRSGQRSLLRAAALRRPGPAAVRLQVLAAGPAGGGPLYDSNLKALITSYKIQQYVSTFLYIMILTNIL